MALLETDRDRDNRIRTEQPTYASRENDDVMFLDVAPAHRRVGSMVSNAPYFEGRDIAAGVAASTMMLGPLLAYAVGFGG